MTNFNWRKLAVWTAIDAMLIVTAGSAMAATTAHAASSSLHLPGLLVLGVGMVTAGRFSRG